MTEEKKSKLIQQVSNIISDLEKIDFEIPPNYFYDDEKMELKHDSRFASAHRFLGEATMALRNLPYAITYEK